MSKPARIVLWIAVIILGFGGGALHINKLLVVALIAVVIVGVGAFDLRYKRMHGDDTDGEHQAEGG
ncbi:hypothetical protein [Sphingomonas oryzagri]|uniref:DUF1328 domain-containing protein n=1 Tax=Sphingomonas oryzagri TaxID=3042314 RepID=A0ABT6N7M2_9SPHN|nr:hypothetical protein [Sphingomonas oryzagri]MDH7641098.1 hypothetical protein [Sphingomonas oryzagri]